MSYEQPMTESQNRAKGAQNGNRNGIVHGLYSYRAMLNGGRLDERSSLYRALREKGDELTQALGGDVSPQQAAIIGDTVKTMLYLGSLDRYLSGLKSLVRKGKVHAVLGERTRLAAHLRENLRTLGLYRKVREQTLEDVLREAEADESEPPASQGTPGDTRSEGEA